MPYMRKTILEKLIRKRFLLVLDDVWTESRFQWESFREFYINIGAPGSRILLTTRSSKVAEMVGSTCPFELPLLSEASSWHLFIESFGMAESGLEPEFLKVGKEIVYRCGGLPLAIKVLAGVLRDKELIEEWEDTRDNNLLDVEGEEHRVFACLRLSYFHLPSHLKQCFTICSVFPKGHMIDKEQLIDQWIAHDMITPEAPVDYLEYIGHKYFNSLVQMSFLQDVAENFYGRMRCRMHDLVHGLARSILVDEISLVVPKKAPSCTKLYRYFSLTEQEINLLPKSLFRKARAIYVDKVDDVAIFGKAFKNARHLRSVTMKMDNTTAQRSTSNAITVLNAMLQVKSLKYLEISDLSLTKLPEAISNIWSLQALHVTNSYLFSLPQSIGKMHKLRTLSLASCAIKWLPDSIGDCQMISSIHLCECNELTMLPNSIGKLQKLTALNLSRCRYLKCLPDSIGDCQMISRIDLCNCKMLTVLPDTIGRNQKLRVLRLGYTKIERLPSSITTLRNLECLDLCACQELVELPVGIGYLEKLQVLNLQKCKKLGGMPAGIGQLSGLQKLCLFVLGEGEQFARISELANVPRVGEELSIRGISHGMVPDHAHMACLKQKKNLQRLCLKWLTYDSGEVNTKLVEDVIDGLEPPSTIKELKIRGYSGRQYARWMKNEIGGRVQGPVPFPFLRVMKLYDFPKLKHLHGLVELPCLEVLDLAYMPSLESISGGPFTSLAKLVLNQLPCLGEVWMVAETTMADGEEAGGGCSSFTPHVMQVRVGSCITEVEIDDCPKLKVKPHLPSSLQHLSLYRHCEHLLQSPAGQWEGPSSSPSFRHLKKLRLRALTGIGFGRRWELLQNMTALESLEIKDSDWVTELPESIGSLTSLLSLNVYNCSAIRMLPEWLGELWCLQELTIVLCDSLSSLPESMGRITSLQRLQIEWCDALVQLPECLGDLFSLRRLVIAGLPGLTYLPQSMCGLTSLEELEISDCPGIKSFPEGVKDLTALKVLKIRGCPDLASRC